MDWFAWDFDHSAYFQIYADKVADADLEGPALVSLLDLPAHSLVLDLPCGWGRLQPHLLAQDLRVVGGDLSPLNLRRHQAEFPSDLVRLDLRALPFQDAIADGVFCAFTSWGYFASDEENQRQLAEFARVLRPGGALLLDLVGREFLQESMKEVKGNWLDFPQEGYQERATWSRDGRRIRTERRCGGAQFRHDIWIPTAAEIISTLEACGFQAIQGYGGLDGRRWEPSAERWIYRAIKR